MIKRVAQMQTEVRSQMRGGEGDTNIQHIFRQEELTGHSRLVAKITLEPGCSIGLHPHDQEEEIYYILKGQGQVTDAGETAQLGPGDAVLTGGGDSHSVKNVGQETLEMVAVILTY